MATAAAVQSWDHDREVRRTTLIEVLARCRWQKQKAARELGIGPTNIYQQMRQFGIPFKQPEEIVPPKLDGDYVIVGRFSRHCIRHHVALEDTDLVCPGRGRAPSHRVIEWEVFDTFLDRALCEVSAYGFLRVCKRPGSRRH